MAKPDAPPQKQASFKDVIRKQHSSGYWPNSCRLTIATFFKSGNCEDVNETLIKELNALHSTGGLTADITEVLLTILAVYIL